MSKKTIGVVLMAFGGPDSPEAIEPFMQNLMGRVPPPPLVAKIKGRYQLIGGKSPLPETTAAQARELENYFREEGVEVRVVVGMCHWHPFIYEAVEQLRAAGVDTIIGVSLAPFYSQVSTGAYHAELTKAVEAFDRPISVRMANAFYDNPFFIEAISEKINDTIQTIPGERAKVPMIFSAHSLPKANIEQGEPYAQQFEFTVQRLVEKLEPKTWRIAYQSKGGGQGEWLGPTVEETMDELQAAGHREVLVVPVGFVSDHIETLYDIDIAQSQHAEKLGLAFYRSEALNTSPIFIRALAATILSEI